MPRAILVIAYDVSTSDRRSLGVTSSSEDPSRSSFGVSPVEAPADTIDADVISIIIDWLAQRKK